MEQHSSPTANGAKPKVPPPGKAPTANTPAPPPVSPVSACDEFECGIDLVERANAPLAVAPALEELRLGASPSCFSMFMTRGVLSRLHWLEHESLRGFAHCLEEGCPVCLAGQKANEVLLNAVYDCVGRRVAILRVSTAEGPHRLWSLLRPHLGSPTMAGSFFTARREGARFFLQVSPFLPGADRGLPQIRQFMDDWKARRISIKSAYPTHSAEELRQLPDIRAYLELHGLMPEAPAIANDEWADDENDIADGLDEEAVDDDEV